MDQHPVPRQITSFQFKLIGFMTLKQFLYLVIFLPTAYIFYVIIPIPVLNIIIAFITAVIGAVFAFLKIQDRPMEDWIKNFIKRLGAPTQYFYQRNNTSLSFLNELYYSQDPHLLLSHIDTKEKLSSYLAMQAKNQGDVGGVDRSKQKTHISDLLSQTKDTDPSLIKKKGDVPGYQNSGKPATQSQEQIKQPYLSGVVKNRRGTPLPGVLISIKNTEGEEIRLLKSNPHGIFATYSPLTVGEYVLTITDPNSVYFFDTMNITVTDGKMNPLTVISKEVL